MRTLDYTNDKISEKEWFERIAQDKIWIRDALHSLSVVGHDKRWIKNPLRALFSPILNDHIKIAKDEIVLCRDQIERVRLAYTSTKKTLFFGGKRGQAIRKCSINLQCVAPPSSNANENRGYKDELITLIPEIRHHSERFSFEFPDGLLFSTQFTQPALALTELALSLSLSLCVTTYLHSIIHTLT